MKQIAPSQPALAKALLDLNMAQWNEHHPAVITYARHLDLCDKVARDMASALDVLPSPWRQELSGKLKPLMLPNEPHPLEEAFKDLDWSYTPGDLRLIHTKLLEAGWSAPA
jgi:hypothetical protein